MAAEAHTGACAVKFEYRGPFGVTLETSDDLERWVVPMGESLSENQAKVVVKSCLSKRAGVSTDPICPAVDAALPQQHEGGATMTGPDSTAGDLPSEVPSKSPDYRAYVEANTSLIETREEIARFRERAVALGCWNVVRLLDSHEALRTLTGRTKTLAREATNGWACYAKRNIELDEIYRLHRALDAIDFSGLASPADTKAVQP